MWRLSLQRATSSWRQAAVSPLASALLGALAASLTLPKLLLADYYERSWIQLTPGGLLGVALQDAVLALACFVAVRRWLARRPARLALPAALSTSLLVLLALDARVRELWLRPVDLALLSYGWANGADLRSGLTLFFNSASGWGMTFRRALALIVGGHLLLWALLALVRRRDASRRSLVPTTPTRSRVGLAAWLLLSLALVAASLRAERRYRLNENVLVGTVLALASRSVTASPCGDAPRFEQPARPFASTLARQRRILSSARPFKSLLLVFLESVRWNDAALTSDDSPLPTLRRLAREGLLARAYAPIPHSSKAYFAVLTGRYPYPGIEMRESTRVRNESFIRSLRDRLHARTCAFTSMHLAFEGTGALLASMGVDRRAQVDELARAAGVGVRTGSSFGEEDAPLFELATRQLAAGPSPFVCLLLPTAAHYPYDYPGKPDATDASHDAYLAALAHTDRNLAAMLDALAARELDRDTLVVFVGDHGESFGEHGTFVHNNSLHEEEVTVPLLFWSSDGRLRNPGVLGARQIDVAPTILDLFGLETDATPVQGESLLRVDGTPRAYLATFFDDVALGVVDFPLKHVYEPGSDRLVRFDLAADASEAHPSIVDGPARIAEVERLLAFQASARAAHCEPSRR